MRIWRSVHAFSAAGFIFAAVCLNVLCNGGAAIAQTTTTVWTATLTVGSTTSDSTTFGWSNEPGDFANDNLTDVDFVYDGSSWNFTRLNLIGSQLTLQFGGGVDTTRLEPLVFHAGSDTLGLRTATISAALSRVVWPNSGLSWSAGDTLELRLTETVSTVSTPDPDPDPEPTSRPPDRPVNLEVTSGGPTRNDLTWTAPWNGGSAITGYRIYVRYATGAMYWRTLEADTGSTETAWSHTGIADASRLDAYRVAAINRHGVGQPSRPADAPDATAVPALPLGGVLALAALLAAGGRVRLSSRRRLC